MNKFFCKLGIHLVKQLDEDGFWDVVVNKKVNYYQCSCGRKYMNFSRSLFGRVETK